MSADRDEKLYETLTRTGELLKTVEPVEGETYTLDAILAEFGRGGAKPAQKADDEDAASARERESGAAAKAETPAAPVDEPAAEDRPDDEGVRRRDRKARRTPVSRGAADDRDFRDTQRLPRITKEMLRDTTPRQSVSPARRPAAPAPERDNTPPDRISLETVMHETVDSVLAENEDGILAPPVPLGKRLRGLLERKRKGPGRRFQDTESLWEASQEPEETAAEEPETDAAEAAQREKNRARRLRRGLGLSAVPLGLLLAAAVLEMTPWMPAFWGEMPLLRGAVWGGGLLGVALLCIDVWRSGVENLKDRRFTCETGLLLAVAVVLADCVYMALGYGPGTEPLALPIAACIFFSQWGLLLEAEGRREAFHLADLGGVPPWAVSAVKAGACRQRGLLNGFFRLSDRSDPARRCQQYLLPLLLAAATVLAGVVCFSDGRMDQILWVWSAHLTAALPCSLLLSAALPLRRLQHRLTKDGSALAGYEGARALSRSRRLVVNENDLFPAGTVAFNGYKVYGEERTRMVSYAAAVTEAAGSPLHELFAQQMAAEGGRRVRAESLRFCEEGGVVATIQGESVAMGSAYFMRKQRVALPHDLKLQTGVFLAVDGVLGAIFVVKYQPSRNVEWALRALRRTGMRPVLAVRSGNVTPGLLKRKFGADSHAIYPDVTMRLALSDLMEQQAEQPNALLYREGLLALAETVIGAQRLVRAVRLGTVLTYVGAAAGLLLMYYLTHVGALGVLTPAYVLAFGLLWLVPTVLLSGLVKHF